MNGEARYVRSPAARLKQVGGTSAVYLKSQRALHLLNPSARLLLDCLDKPRSLSALVARLAELSGADRETVERDLRAALPELERRGIVERRG